MEGVRPGTSGSVCVSRDVSLSTLVLPHTSSSSWTGRDGADVTEASSVCFSGAPRQEGPSVLSRGLEISPPSRTMETVGLASEGAQLVDSGLSTEVVETILLSRAPSTRKLYALK